MASKCPAEADYKVHNLNSSALLIPVAFNAIETLLLLRIILTSRVQKINHSYISKKINNKLVPGLYLLSVSS